MGGGGKGGTTTSTQTVQIPPEVLARYNAVNARAEQVAQQPFQPYGGEFVAPLTPTQTAGIQATNVASGQAQPYYGAATRGLLGAQQGGAGYINAATQAALAGGAPITPDSLQTQQFMNPYTQSVVGATQAAMGQQFGQQQAQQQAEAIRAGAYGGDRAGLQRQALRGQQALAGAQAIAPLYQQGYQQAQQTGLQVAQANRAALQGLGTQLAGLGQQGYTMGAGTAQQLAGLGTGAQQAALQGAQAQLAAGQIQQQTQQAQDTAQYQQFLQERGYPFQVAQFLANIAMGTGALSGSTTTGSTTQPGGFFSDKRLKEDVKEIGETHDGQPIYSYKYRGDDRTQIGLMAQDVEKKHPEAVGLMGGYKTVDYKKATENAERTHKDMGGGLMPDGFDYNSMGGAVTSNMAGEGFERGGYVGGGLVGADDWAQIIAANKQALGVYGGQQPMGGGSPGATGIVPAANIPVPKPIEAAKLTMPAQRPSGMSTAMQTGKDIAATYKGGKELYQGLGEAKDWLKDKFAEGGLVPRHAYADGGSEDSQAEEAIPYDPSDVMRGRDPMEGVLKAGSQRPQQLKAAQMSMSGSGGGGGLLGAAKDVAGLVGAGKTLFDAGTAIASFLPFSDARAKDNIRPVGKTFDGQNIYSYNIGEGPTQMGLMAQEVLERKPEAVGRRGGYLTVDYDRATEDATPFAYGGLVPRQGYATRGGVDASEEIPAQATETPVEAAPADDRLERTLGALRRIESGGRYDITGPASRRGDRPYGAYQIMGANIPSWTEEALGRRMTPEEFLKDQAAQDATARHRAGLYMKQYDDPRQVASMWLSGKPMEKAGNVADVLGTNVPKYVSMFDRYYGGQDLAPGGKQPGLKPPADIGGAPSGAGEKKSLGDVVTSEGFIVPALGFLGSMLASNRPNLGQALGEGIMGGVGAYQAQQKQASELAKKAAETKLTEAEVPRTEMQTQAIKAGIFERRFVPNRGWQVINKATNEIFYVTDANLNPISGTGFEKSYQKIPVAGGGVNPESPTAVRTNQGIMETDITKLVKPPKSAADWKPITSVPEQYEPKEHSRIVASDDSLKSGLVEGTKTKAVQSAKAEGSGKQRIELEQMLANLEKLPQSGFFGTSGPGAETRLQMGLALNTAAAMIGGKPLTDPNVQAAQEAMKKGSFRLGAALSNSIGSREPGFIVAQAVGANPTIESSERGFKLLAAGLLQSAAYEEDKARFYDDYLSRFQHLSGAEDAFKKLNPPEYYAQKAVISAVDPVVLEELKRYGPQEKLRKQIDETYGRGITDILMGKKRNG